MKDDLNVKIWLELNLGLVLFLTAQKVRLMDNQVQKGHKPNREYYCKLLFPQPQKTCFYTEYATWAADLFCSFIFPFFQLFFFTDIISIKRLVRENCPASAVECYFTFTALEKCSTIHLLGNILLDWNNFSFYKQFWSWQCL